VAKSRRKRRRRPSGEHRQPQLTKRQPKPPPEARASASRRRASAQERPPAPWGSFPLQELAVLVALLMLGIGVFTTSPVAIAVGVVLGCLAGLELSAREHFAGYRSHTVLIAGTAFVLTVGALYYAAHLILVVCLGIGAAVFLAAFFALRRAFQRASGGLSFRVGGLRS
jgi:hypothetical protein